MLRTILLPALASALGGALVLAVPALAQEPATAAGIPDASQPPIANAPVDQPDAATPPAAPNAAADAATSDSRPMADPDAVTVRNVSPVELVAGTLITDGSGKTIGTVKKVAGNDIVVTDGSADYRVPVTQIYAWRDGAADHFASRLPKSAMTAQQPGAQQGG